ncbi:MAG: DUF11 domain-containing protein, partial [Chromatiaceae bacterium]|nr:DUF11 domain-containing protein [Chromatiaceae bacterium]
MSQQPPRWKKALSSLLSAGIGAAAIFTGALLAPTPALAHNLQTKMVYMFPDSNTQQMLDDRIAGLDTCFPSYAPPDPLLRGAGFCENGTTPYAGDEIGLVIKVVPRDGTTTGVGGHVDFYVPNGVEVVDVGYLLPNGGPSGFDKVPMKGQSLIAVGAGPIGAKATAELATLTGTYTNILGVTAAPVVSGTGLHRGTISGVYGDTGIFFSTDPDTAYGSWQRYTGDALPGDETVCGVVGSDPRITGKTITNNSGDVFVPCNKWDAEQMYAWGVKGTSCTLPGCKSTPIVDYGDGRGNAPWGFAAGTAGPQSGYAWNFDWDEYVAGGANDAADILAAMSDDEVGPWQRLRYPGSRAALDNPGSASVALGIASTDASTLGTPVSSLSPLPLTQSQTDTTSPKTIRWAVGQLTNLIPEYVWVKIRVKNPAAMLNQDGCPVFQSDTFGGDAGGTDNGKDHLWRYYEPSRANWNGCVALGKPTDAAAAKVGDILQFPVKIYNMGDHDQHNVVIVDTLPSGVSFVSAVPAQNGGPNPLVWVVGTLLQGDSFESLVTVRVTGTGAIDNKLCVTSDEFPNPECSSETVSNVPVLKQTKTVSDAAVAPGATVTYTLRIDNIGSVPSAGPTKIEEHLDPNLTYQSVVSATLNGASVTPTVTGVGTSDPVFTFATGINAGSSLVLKFTALVSASADPGEYCNYYTAYAGSVPNTTGGLACLTVGAGAIGDFVWRDWNGNGMQDAGEEGIPGVTVKLYVDDGDGIFEPAGGDAVGVQTDVTDANGLYGFTGLAAANYWVVIDSGVPADYVLTSDPQGALDGQALVVLPLNGATSDIDFGYRPAGTAAINGTVYEDSAAPDNDYSAADTEIDNVTVNLYEDTNGNGVLDSGDLLIATDVSDASGFYEFTGLASGLSYLVDIVQTDPDLASHFGADAYAAVPGADGSDPRPVPNLSGTSTQDFGYDRILPSSIGDEVFIDLDGSGDVSAGDTPLANVTVTLYQDLNGNGILDANEESTAVA